MRVMLLSPNRLRVIVPPFPLGLAYVASSIDSDRHTVEVWDALFHDRWEESLRNRLRVFHPEVIGLSVRNVDDQEIRAPQFLLEGVAQVVHLCREETRAILVAGGPGFSIFPAEAMDYLGVDFGIVGEGERAFGHLLERLEMKAEPADIPGLIWRDGGQLRANPPQRIADLDALAGPDRVRLNAAAYYQAQGTAGIPNVMTIQSKRGCDQACIYCSTPLCEGNTIRMRSPESVADEVAELSGEGFQRIQFVDSLFTNPRWHAEAICEELLRRSLKVAWSCTIHPGFGDPALLTLMKRAGCTLVMVGNESGSSGVLENLKKGFTREAVERCFSACERAGLAFNAFLLLGGPGEERDSVRESVDLLESVSPAQVTVTVGIRLYPGCGLTRLAEQEGIIARGTNLLVPRFYLARAIRTWIWEYLGPVMRRNVHWVY